MLFRSFAGVILLSPFVFLIAAPPGAISGSLKAPWGKDTTLIKEGHTCLLASTAHIQERCKPRTHLLQEMALSAIWFHKKVISPADGPRSHFRPNSSQYTIDAIQRYGLWHGYLLGCDRLMRENPEAWIYRTITIENGWITKWDPVR